MRYVVFGSDIRYSLKINADMASNVVIRVRKGRIRFYTEGGYEEYAIAKVIKDGSDVYFVAGPLVKQAKADYARPVKNTMEV